MKTKDPALMSRVERRTEVAKILAAGFRRRIAEQKEAKNQLEEAPESRLHAVTVSERRTP